MKKVNYIVFCQPPASIGCIYGKKSKINNNFIICDDHANVQLFAVSPYPLYYV